MARVTQNIPFSLFMALNFGAFGTAATPGTTGSASLDVQVEGESPTDCNVFGLQCDMPEIVQSFQNWNEITHALLPSSRPMSAWERQVADDFFMSHLR
jgi:hypothetical protein